MVSSKQKQRQQQALRRTGPAWIVAVISTVNILQFAVIGWLGVPINWLVYVGGHGDLPKLSDSTGSRGLWVGHMPFPVPWWYFAATGLVVLAVVVYAFAPRRRFVTAESRFALWRTTPRFLAAAALLMALSVYLTTDMYDTSRSLTSPYLLGAYLCLTAAVVSLVAWRAAPETAEAAGV